MRLAPSGGISPAPPRHPGLGFRLTLSSPGQIDGFAALASHVTQFRVATVRSALRLRVSSGRPRPL